MEKHEIWTRTRLELEHSKLAEQNEKMLEHIKGECITCEHYDNTSQAPTDLEVSLKYCTTGWCSTKDLIAEVEGE